ncbi:glycosyltransferase [candidate division KSB1 bacterium]
MPEIIQTYFFKLLFYYNYFVLGYFVVLNSIYLFMTFLSFISIRKYMREYYLIKHKRLFQSTFYKPISIIAPAYNEEATIVASITSLLQLRYPEFEVIVVNDGSSDNTLEILKSSFGLEISLRPVHYYIKCEKILGVYRSKDYANLVVVNKVNGRKADALNAGINISKYPLISVIDADSVLEPDVMLKMIRPFLDDIRTVAVGGIVRVVNGCTVRSGEVTEINLTRRLLPNFQIVEYLRSFLFGRVGWDVFNSLLVISGAFGLFRKDVVIQSGGYLHETVGEDMELVVRIHRTMREKKIPYKVTFVAEPVCWTEVPESVKILGRQRNRWQRGLIDSLLLHKKMLLNPKYGVVGMFAMPFFFLFEMLGPLVEFTGFVLFFFSWYFGIVNVQFAILFLLVAVIFGVVLSLASLVLEELSFRKYPKVSHILILFLFGILENFGYRQLHSWWRFKGIIDYFRGKKQWGKMERKGI